MSEIPLLHPTETPQAYMDRTVIEKLADTDPQFPPLGPDGIPPKAEGTVLRMIYWAHTAENAPGLVPLLEGCDIYAAERVSTGYSGSLTDAVEKEIDKEQLLTLHVAGECDDDATQRLNKRGHAVDQLKKMSIVEREAAIRKLSRGGEDMLLTHFMNKFEKVVFLDAGANETDQMIHHERKIRYYDDAVYGAIKSGELWGDVQTSVMHELMARADFYRDRELITRGQLGELAAKNPGKTIGVLYGSDHMPMTRFLDIPETSVQQYRTLMKSHDPATYLAALHRYYSANLATSRAGFFNTRVIDGTMSNRIMTQLATSEQHAAMNTSTVLTVDQVAAAIKLLWSESQPASAEGIDALHEDTRTIIQHGLDGTLKSPREKRRLLSRFSKKRD